MSQNPTLEQAIKQALLKRACILRVVCFNVWMRQPGTAQSIFESVKKYNGPAGVFVPSVVLRDKLVGLFRDAQGVDLLDLSGGSMPPKERIDEWLSVGDHQKVVVLHGGSAHGLNLMPALRGGKGDGVIPALFAPTCGVPFAKVIQAAGRLMRPAQVGDEGPHSAYLGPNDELKKRIYCCTPWDKGDEASKVDRSIAGAGYTHLGSFDVSLDAVPSYEVDEQPSESSKRPKRKRSAGGKAEQKAEQEAEQKAEQAAEGGCSTPPPSPAEECPGAPKKKKKHTYGNGGLGKALMSYGKAAVEAVSKVMSPVVPLDIVEKTPSAAPAAAPAGSDAPAAAPAGSAAPDSPLVQPAVSVADVQPLQAVDLQDLQDIEGEFAGAMEDLLYGAGAE